MAKHNVYAVALGANPVTKEEVRNVKCRTWNECKEYIIGVKGAVYKGFLTNEEADAWLAAKFEQINQSSKSPDDDSNISKPISKSGSANNHSADAIHDAFIEVCRELHISDEDVINAFKKDFVTWHNFIKDKEVQS